MIPINARLPIGAPTPNLDRLASEGMRFVNYYGQASCTAGRASFITGRIPIRTSLSRRARPRRSQRPHQTDADHRPISEAGELHDRAAWQMACRRQTREFPDIKRLRRDVRHAALLCRGLRLCRQGAAPELPQQRQVVHGAVESGRPFDNGTGRPAPRRRR